MRSRDTKHKQGLLMWLFVMSIYALVTATIAVTSMHRDQVMAARILNCESSII